MDCTEILNALSELLYITENDGITPIFFNKSWYEYTGLTKRDVAQGWSRIVNPHDAERISSIIKDAVEHKKPYEVEVRLKNGVTGDYKWFLSKAVPVFNAINDITFYVGVSIDIDDTKRSIRDMEAVYEKTLNDRLERIKELETELEIHRTNT
jgi:PAS domain S-box-containing protein